MTERKDALRRLKCTTAFMVGANMIMSLCLGAATSLLRCAFRVAAALALQRSAALLVFHEHRADAGVSADDATFTAVAATELFSGAQTVTASAIWPCCATPAYELTGARGELSETVCAVAESWSLFGVWACNRRWDACLLKQRLTGMAFIVTHPL